MKKNHKKILFCFLCFLWIVNLPGQSEPIVVNEHFENRPLTEVFELLKTRYGLAAAYDYESIKEIRVNKEIEGIKLKDAIALLLEGTGLTWQFSGNNRILIREKSEKANPENLKTYEISGTVTDAVSGEPLPFAEIFCEEIGVGTTSGQDGRFKLKLKTEEEILPLTVRYLGYESKDFQLQYDKSPFQLVAGLKPAVHEFQEITVLERLPAISTSSYQGALSLHTSSLNALPSFVGGKDLFKSLQLMPGISAHDDLSADLHIRGSGSGETLLVLDGMTLYNVNHFFGIFSAINPNVISTVNIYKNTFPIQYGARTSGVVEMESTAFQNRSFSAGLEVNFLTSNAWLHLPLSKNMGLLVGGRITNMDLGGTNLFNLANQDVNLPEPSPNPNPNNNFGRQQFISNNPNFRFYDINAKWSWQAHENTLFTANFFRGHDRYQYNYEEEFTLQNGGPEIGNYEFFQENASWSNTGLSLQWQQKWSPKMHSEWGLSYSGHHEMEDLEASLVRINLINSDSNYFFNNQSNQIEQYDLNWKNRIELSKQQNLTFGYNLTYHDINLDIRVDSNSILQNNKDGFHQTLYLQHDQKIRKKTGLTLGIRGTYFSGTEKFYLSPRIKLTHPVNKKWKIKGSWSLNNQFLRQSSHENRYGRRSHFWVLADEGKFPTAQSNNLMAGFNFFGDFIELDVEFFHKTTKGVLEHALAVPRPGPNNPNSKDPDGYQVFTGNRTAVGVDILLKKHSGKYSGWIAYTLSKTTDRFRDISNNDPYPSEYDRPHQLNVVNRYRFGKWDFSATYIFASGKPFIDFSFLNGSNALRQDLIIEDVQTRLKAYHRADMGINYNFKWKRFKGNIGLSVFNLFNRDNVKYRQYIHVIPGPVNQGVGSNGTLIGNDLELLGLTPNFNFALKF